MEQSGKVGGIWALSRFWFSFSPSAVNQILPTPQMNKKVEQKY